LKAEILIKRYGAGLAIAAALAVLSILQMVGCSETNSSNENDAQATRLSVNHPTNVDLKHDAPVPPDKVLEIQVDFAPRNQAEFDQFMRAIDDKQSPDYHHWLTPEEMHARFGETPDQFHAVEQWIKSEGFTITDESYGANADYIKFKGTTAQVEQTFKIKLVEPVYDRFINSEDPAIPPQFVGVISRVEGLYGLLQP
jgi:subtilase family serine protease